MKRKEEEAEAARRAKAAEIARRKEQTRAAKVLLCFWLHSALLCCTDCFVCQQALKKGHAHFVLVELPVAVAQHA